MGEGVYGVAGDGFEDTVVVGANRLSVNDVDLVNVGQRVDHTERDAVDLSTTSRVEGSAMCGICGIALSSRSGMTLRPDTVCACGTS